MPHIYIFLKLVLQFFVYQIVSKTVFKPLKHLIPKAEILGTKSSRWILSDAKNKKDWQITLKGEGTDTKFYSYKQNNNLGHLVGSKKFYKQRNLGNMSMWGRISFIE